MRTEIATALAALAAVSSAREIHSAPSDVMKREVPQEHSHRKFVLGVKAALDLNNRFNILDPIFALLGNAAAANGAGEVVNLDCLQQIIADEAFTNARAINDLDGMINALVFRTLERNTLTVGETSALCNEIALNPEINILDQHQDPASDDADAVNGAIELELARQLAIIGADPLIALQSATFVAGEIGDPTAAGNTCSDELDNIGCIFTLNLIRPAISADDIVTAVADILDDAALEALTEAAAVADPAADAIAAAGGDVAAAVEEADASADADVSAAVEEDSAEEEEVSVSANGVNIQAFDGQLGGPAPAVIQSDNERPFEVNGATFLNAGAALQRSCAIQNNACANAANSGQLEGGVGQCNEQEQQCRAQAAAVARKMRRGLYARQGLDLGSCSNPTIQFAEGLDGRQQASFGPVNNADFNHGSANAVRIISDFICSRLASSCDASEETVAACESASTAAQAAQAAGQDGAQVAAIFNSALGA